MRAVSTIAVLGRPLQHLHARGSPGAECRGLPRVRWGSRRAAAILATFVRAAKRRGAAAFRGAQQYEEFSPRIALLADERGSRISHSERWRRGSGAAHSGYAGRAEAGNSMTRDSRLSSPTGKNIVARFSGLCSRPLLHIRAALKSIPLHPPTPLTNPVTRELALFVRDSHQTRLRAHLALVRGPLLRVWPTLVGPTVLGLSRAPGKPLTGARICDGVEGSTPGRGASAAVPC